MSSTEQLSDAKRRLLERHLRGEVARQNWELPVPVRAPGDSTPMAPGQQHLLLHAQMAPGMPIYNESVTLYYKGKLDRQVFTRAFHELLRRHEIWRTGFVSVGNETVQAVYDNFKIEVPFHDLTSLPEDRREPEALNLARADMQRPMDLSVGPLLRVKLVRLAEEDYRFYVTVHHLIHDGVTIYGVFFPELTALYDAFVEGLPSPLPEPKLQFGDYAVWQKRLIDNDSAARQMDYWRRELSGELPQWQLPSDRPRPAVPSFKGSMETFYLPLEMTQALKQLSRDEGVTFYMLLLAGFKAMMHRYTGQDDIIVGGLTDGRRRREFQSLMGYFLNTLPLRTRPTGSMTFRQYLATVKDTVLGSLANSDVLFDHLVREIAPRRDPTRHPLFQVMFLIEPPPTASSPHWDLKQGEVKNGVSKFDLYFEVEERRDGLVGRVEYSEDLFDVETIHRMIGHWSTLLNGVLRNPEALLSDLPILTAEETRLVTAEWNDTSRPVPHTTIHGAFEARAALTPRAIAVECDGIRLSYGELNQEANRLARRLQEAGAGSETLVALCVERSCDMVVSLLGILKAGAAYLPLDPALPQERFDLILEDAQAPILLTERGRDVTPHPGTVVVYTDEGSGTSANLDSAGRPEDLAYVLYTSGSTGRPKGVEIQHAAVVNFLESMRREPGFTAAETLLAVTTLSFDIAALEIFLPLVCGGRVVIASREDARDPVRLAELFREIQPTVMQATPATWRALLDTDWKGSRDLALLCGGEAMPRDLAQALLPRCASLWNLYGPTETTVWSSVQRITAVDGVVPIGHPIANTQLYVLDRYRQLAPAGIPGELYIGGAGLARGYLRRDELTREKFTEIPGMGRLYRTGDLARWRKDGVMECLGRTDNQLKIRGFRVEPEEIESALLQHPEIRAAAVKAWPDGSGHLSLTAYVVSPERPSVRAFLDSKLPEYMIPPRVVFLDELPMTPNKKVDRNRLPEPQQEETPLVSIAPSTLGERRLLAIWESVLSRKDIGVTDNFFDLGGHSLLVAKLLRRVDDAFAVRMSMADMFLAPTIRQFAELLNKRDATGGSPKLVRIQTDGSRTPLFWMNAGPGLRALAKYLGKERPFYGVTLSPEEETALGESPSLPQIAACLVSTIRGVQPEGPYLLGGRCVSGLLAYEAAAQLRAAGQNVELLFLLDSLNPVHFLAIPRWKLLASRVRLHFKNSVGSTPVRSLSYILGRLKYRLGRLRPEEGTGREAWDRKLFRAARQYHPQGCQGRMVLLQPAEGLDVAGLAESWSAVSAAGREVYEVLGNHETVLKEPTVQSLATRLLLCLESAEPKVERLRRLG
ncbi:MAG TPA: amino acid adenylation domain-containing protein [Bryobacteraceae bacterium]|jgi:amino acid adenylation domain-containing protein